MNPQLIADIKRIQKARSNNKLAVFVGAGVSNNSGIPTWGKLLDAFKAELGDFAKDESDSLKIAQYYFNLRGKKEYLEKVKEVLKHGQVSYNPIHDAILDLEPSHIITTNYDDLIEQALMPRNLQYHIVRKDSDLPYIQTDRLVVKMHGDYDAGNIVLTEKDYLDYRTNFPLIDAYVKSLFATKLVLFVGFSFADYNLRFIVNYIQSLLQDDFQPVYMLVSEPVNHIIKEYYKKKGINLVELISLDLDELIQESKILIDNSISFADPRGGILYKQLRLIDEFEEGKDLIDYLFDKLKPLENELMVFNDGLKYFFPKKERPFWNLHSDGLQILSPYIEQNKNIIQSRSFIKQNKDKIVFLRKVAYYNNIGDIDRIKLMSKSFLKKYTRNYRDYEPYFICNYKKLESTVRLGESKKLTYTIEDLDLPYDLYRVGHYYAAYVKFKQLASVYWQSQRYVLYFICLYNQKMLGLYAKSEKNNDKAQSQRISREIKKIDLNKVLDTCPFDQSLYSFFRDLVSGTYFSNVMKETYKLLIEIADDKQMTDNGGLSINSHLSLMISHVYRLMNFGDINRIVYLHDSFNSRSLENAAAAILIGNSIKDFEHNKLMQNSKIVEITASQLKVILFYNTYKELDKVVERYSIGKIVLSENAINYIHRVIESLLDNDDKSIKFVANQYYYDVIEIILFILSKTKIADSYVIENLPKLYLKYELYKGKQSLVSSSSAANVFKLMSDFIRIYEIQVDDAIVMLEKVFSRVKTGWKPVDLTIALTQSLKKKDIKLDNIVSLSDINYKNESDFLYLCALYSVLTEALQLDVVTELERVFYSIDEEDIVEGYRVYDVPLFTMNTIDIYLDKIRNSPPYYWYILHLVEKDERCSEVHQKIREFKQTNDFLLFLDAPLEYTDVEKIEARWLLYIEKDDFRQLLKDDELNHKVRHLFDNPEYGRYLKKRFMEWA